ncbi:TIGR02444 family protein [Halomonas aquamarina]|uniref:TIGR02444 family protein n=1 Tax=Vreelandella aquamarina TaxID=77097 RepID=A0ACC5VUK6_9GAMM|nr:TIGR02444 family protein [Halomonas aquamarina]MBZ5487589.1 TIGR02444 family protein [Halomonas aquamarina]
MLDSNRLRHLEQMPLWDFALAFYSEPEVERACLTLQDAGGVDVCELLLHGWLFVHGLEALPDALAEQRQSRQAWQRQVTQVLRHLRRRLKPEASNSEAIAALRKTIQQAELQAERENLQRWQAWALDLPEPQQRLRNRAETSHDVEKWLQDRFFFAELEAGCAAAPDTHESVSRAWLSLATRLDRFEVPR